MDKETYKKRLLDIYKVDVYNELINFWKIVEESKYDYKIFVSKKCYVLYKVFMPIFDFNSYIECKKITDVAIPVYIDKMKNTTVLVIDDVFIHGRAVSKVDGQIGGRAKKIDYYTFAKNTNNEIPQDTNIKKNREKNENSDTILNYIEMLNKALLTMQEYSVKGYLNCNEYQWKRISDLIMKSLWGVNMPYASYLPVFNMKDKNRLFTTESSKDFIEYSSHSQKEQNQYFTYFIQSDKKNIVNNSIIHFCFIISKNDFIKDCKMIPMVFFDCENTSIDKKFILDSIDIIYEEESNELYNYFINGRKDKQGLISLQKYLIFSVGFLASKRYFIKNGIKAGEYSIDYSNADYSFGKEIRKYLLSLENKESLDILRRIQKCTIKNTSYESKNRSIYFEEREKLLEGLRQSYSDMKSCSIEKNFPDIIDVLARYFKFNNIYNEENFYKFKQGEKKYITGLKFSEIKEFLESKGFGCKEIIFGLMYQYSLGAATIDFLYDYDKKGNIIGINMYWRAGEQSYKCISQTYVLIVYFQNIYKKMFNKQVADFLYDVLLEVAKDNYLLFKIPFSKRDIENYCNIGDNVYNAFDIERYCKREEYKYLGYIANEMQQYILRGHLQEAIDNDKITFKRNLFEFMKYHSDQDMLYNCQKILWRERTI